MSKEQQPAAEQVEGQELEDQEGRLLPPREVMSIVDLGEGVGGGPIHTLPVEPRDEI